jgi:hypothetical protein
MSIVSRVYLQVHNRGKSRAHNVRVVLLACRDNGGVPELPNDFQLEVQRGTSIEGDGWLTVGQHLLNDVLPGRPAVVRFELSTDNLKKLGAITAGSNFRLLALLDHDQDRFTATTRNVQTLTNDERKAAGKKITTATLVAGAVPDAPMRTNSWKPIGPAGILKGQAPIRCLMSGRVPDIAIARDGRRVYAATCNAGVWRSDDRGAHWRPCMRGFDLNPEGEAHRFLHWLDPRGIDTLSMGAIALDENNPDRIYVGTGEAHNGYMGVGPLISTDGGQSWKREPLREGNLIGHGFFALAVDPADTQCVVAATTNGIYRREPEAQGSSIYYWHKKRPMAPPPPPSQDIYSSVVVARNGGNTRFFAARYGGRVFESANGGDTWTEIAGYPTAAGVLRVLLAIQRGNINTIYAYNQLGDVHRVTRANIGAAWGAWRQIGNLPGANDLRTDQLYYDMALDVAPDNVNVLLIGSSYRETSPGVYGGGIYRLTIGAGSNVTDADYLGNSIHPDIHCIRFRPGSSREMWVGCDGGMFYAEDAYAEGANVFINRNAGLQSLEMNHLGVHPRSEAVLFCGTQDNGGLRYTGEEAWLHVTGGDGGYAVVDRNDPHNYLISYVRRKIFGSTVGSFSREAHGRGVIVPPHPTAGDQELFYAPLEVSPTGNSQFLAFGSRALWISINFGGAAAADWNYSPLIAPVDPANVGRSCICCIRIVSPNLVYVGTLDGQVLRYRNPPPPPPGAAWPAPNMLHNDNEVASGGAFSVITRGRPITSIAIDPALPNNESLYITLGGNGNWQRVWHYDATANNWQHRSGTGTNRLLSSIATKIIVDPNHNDHLYVGTDVGIWQSTDSGTNWRPFSNRLPDTTIKDLEWHSGGGIKLLRASTYGSGVWEYLMDNDQVPAVELYLRNSQLDGGREGVTTQYGANWTDPTDTAKTQTRFGSSPDIKIDRPNNSGNYTFDHYHTASYVDFVDTLPDPDSCATAVVHEQPIVNRVYIQVHNRGIVQADEVEVVLLVGARTAANVPANLPNDWRTRILLGGTINTNDWKLIGRKKLDGINAALPQVVRFDILSTHLPRPSDLPAQQHKGLLAIVYHRRYDPLRGNEVAVQDLCNNHRQAAYKSITVSRFTGTLPQEVEALPAFVPNLVPLTVAALTARKLRELNRQLQLKIGTAGATIRPTERRVQRMAERAVAMFESGETVPAPQDLDLFTGFSKFALLGCMIWDLPDFADILSPKRGWIGDVMRRGTPDPNLSHALVPSSQFAVRAGEIAVSRASDSERPKVQAFVMGMMSALASNVTCNPLLRGMQANRSSIDWDHRRIGIDDYAVSLWIAKELLSNIPSSDQWQSWWPERSEVPDAIFEGIAEALTEVYDPASVTAAVFSDNPASEIDTSVPSAEDIADGYRFYYNTMGSSSGALVWFLILSPLLLMPSVALLISLGMPNAKRLLTTEKKEPNESSWYELYVTSMATGSLFPFIYSMILWGIVPKNTSYFVQALLFGLARFGIAAASFATTSASPELRWGLLFSTPTAFDIYFLIRTIVSAAKGHPGYARLWLLQMFPILTAGANLIFALMSFKGNREKSWVFWLLWAVYTLGIWLGVGIYSAIAIARDGGLFSLLSNRTDPDRPDLTGIDQRSLYRLTESSVSVFHDSLLWEQGGADLAHKRYPSGKRSLIKIWVDHDNMHIRHDRDIVVIKRGDDETPVPLDGPMTPAAIVTELVKVDGVHAEIYSNDDPAYDLPAPKMFADPGDSSQTWAEHDEKSDDFVPLSRDQNSPYILCHTPRSALCSTLGAAGTSSSEDVPLRLVPEGGTEAFDGTGVDMAADLASLFCMGATPSVNGEDIAVPNIAAPDNTLDKVYQIFHQWNLDERRVDEWKMMFAGGATTQAEGVRPTPSGYSAVDSGASLAAVMGWRPLFKAWSTMAADRHSDTTSEKTHRRTPFVRQNTAPAKQPKNNELTNAIRFLLDLPE